MIEPNLRLLVHQVTLLNAAVHAILMSLSSQQKSIVDQVFDPLAQQTQAALEASASPETELVFFVEMRQSLSRAIQNSITQNKQTE